MRELPRFIVGVAAVVALVAVGTLAVPVIDGPQPSPVQVAIARPVAVQPSGLTTLEAPRAEGDTPASAAPRSRVAILIAGMCTWLEPDYSPVSTWFMGHDGIGTYLVARGWNLLGYSYTGGRLDAQGDWRPNPYQCDDSTNRRITDDAAMLDAEIRAYTTRHPNTDVYLIGHSQGGLVAFAYLARLESEGWTLPGAGRLRGVATLDSPLGGVPFTVSWPNAHDMASVWFTGAVGAPAGAMHSVGSLFGMPVTNELLADDAARAGVRILTVGNLQDHVYETIVGPSYEDTQWITSRGADSGVYARTIDSGAAFCPVSTNPVVAMGCNHDLVISDPAVQSAVAGLFESGATPRAADACEPLRGGCLALPPGNAPIAPAG